MNVLLLILGIIALFLVGMVIVIDYIDEENRKRDDEIRRMYMEQDKETLEKMLIIERLMDR